MSAPSCGSCALCCTVMRVAMEPPKSEYEKCWHCTGTGCGIYDARPDACRGFQCLWLASQRVPSMALPAAMRPDRSGVVIDLNEAGTMIAHCARPGSWRREPARSFLLRWAARAAVVLEMPAGAEQLAADGSTHPLVKVGVDTKSNNRLYVREADMERYLADIAA